MVFTDGSLTPEDKETLQLRLDRMFRRDDYTVGFMVDEIGKLINDLTGRRKLVRGTCGIQVGIGGYPDDDNVYEIDSVDTVSFKENAGILRVVMRIPLKPRPPRWPRPKCECVPVKDYKMKTCASCGESIPLQYFYRFKNGHIVDDCDFCRREARAFKKMVEELEAESKPAPTRRCNRCDIVKPMTSFFRDRVKGRGGYMRMCKACYMETRRARDQRRPYEQGQ